MIWTILIISLGLASARNVENVSPEHLDFLRSTGQDEEFARLLGVDVNLVRPNPEERAEGSIMNMVSALGDIMLTEEQERNGINFGKYGGSRWSGAEIAYWIRESDFTPDQVTIIRNAIANLNSKGCTLKLVPYNGHKDYCYVYSGSGCWSYLGRTGGQQALSLQENGCVNQLTVQHEFIHAAGFTHEHNRQDRDENVEVLWPNIQQRWQSQYQKVENGDYVLLGKYEHYSCMHYPHWSPGNSKYDAFRILISGIDKTKLGQGENNALTREDCRKLKLLYS